MARAGRSGTDVDDGGTRPPSVLFFHVDNLGFGELSCYSGGPFRGTATGRIDAFAGEGPVQWEQTLGDLLTDAGYACAVYGKWHVGEGPGRWPTDKGFAEWYGPPRTYDEALWPTDPWYDPQRDPESRMVEIKKGQQDVTEGEQLTLDVRRDCDVEYFNRILGEFKASTQREPPIPAGAPLQFVPSAKEN